MLSLKSSLLLVLTDILLGGIDGGGGGGVPLPLRIPLMKESRAEEKRLESLRCMVGVLWSFEGGRRVEGRGQSFWDLVVDKI